MSTNSKKALRDIAAEKKQAELDAVTRKVALAVVFLSIFIIFIKLLFL